MITLDYRGERGSANDNMIIGGRGSPKYYIIILILVLNNEYFT